jgi:hypothetical protein
VPFSKKFAFTESVKSITLTSPSFARLSPGKRPGRDVGELMR